MIGPLTRALERISANIVVWKGLRAASRAQVEAHPHLRLVTEGPVIKRGGGPGLLVRCWYRLRLGVELLGWLSLAATALALLLT